MVTTPYNLPKGLFMVDDITTNGANAGRMLEDESSMAKAQEGLEGIDVSELGKRRWCVYCSVG